MFMIVATSGIYRDMDEVSTATVLGHYGRQGIWSILTNPK